MSIERILQEKEPMKPRDLAINGDDLKLIGIKQGKVMGQILRKLMEKVIDNPEFNTRDQLLIIAEKMALDSEGGDQIEK
jgi:tRNA nucleotidyltransferase (CCA-adding enzyme)